MGGYFHDSSKPRPNPSLEAKPAARCHHYVLAHQALRNAAFGDPVAYLGLLGSPDARRWLAHLLEAVAQQCAMEPPRDFTADEIAIYCTRAGRFPCAVIEMPPPKAPPEAYFTAAILTDTPNQKLPNSGRGQMRYLTLEFGVPSEGRPRTLLCEWTTDGTHQNYGDGPEPKIDAFVRLLSDMMEA